MHRREDAAALPAQLLFLFRSGIFCLTMEFSEDYPNKAPVVKFVTKMYHPNSESVPRGGSRSWSLWELACPWFRVLWGVRTAYSEGL